MHGENDEAFGDPGYIGVEKRSEPSHAPSCFGPSSYDQILERILRLKFSLRSRIDQTFWVIRCWFGYVEA